MPEDQRELEQAGALHAHCLQVSEEPNNVRPPFEGTCAALCCAAWWCCTAAEAVVGTSKCAA